MIFQKSFNNRGGGLIRLNQGLIISDILVALSLATLFIMIITQTSSSARDMFDDARIKDHLLQVYEDHTQDFIDLLPYESRQYIIEEDDGSTTTIRAIARWYGNDRIQTDIVISTQVERMVSATFNMIRPYPFEYDAYIDPTPLCSVDFSNKNTVGSYAFAQQTFNPVPEKVPDPQNLDPHIVSITLPIDASLPLTSTEIRNGRAYIATDSTWLADPDVLIVDMSDPENPELRSGIHTGPGISMITLAGEYIFAAVTSRTAQVQSIRIDGMDNMSIEASYKLPLPYASATPSLGSAIAFDTNFIYLGTEKWDGEEFSIINVSDPANPQKISGAEIGSKVESILVRHGHAYVATAGEKQLILFDVRDPYHPVLVDHFAPSGWERQEGKSLVYFEDALSFGRTAGGFNVKKDHELFGWDIGSSTPTIGEDAVTHSLDIAGGIYGIVMDRSFIYLANRQTGRELYILGHGFSTSTARNIPLPAIPQTLTCDNDSLYVLATHSPVIYQISFK